MAEVIQLDDPRELPSLRMAWNALFAGTPGASFFHTFDWHELYWQHCGDDRAMRVLVVVSGGRPIGIVPLVVRTDRFRVGPLRVLTYPLDNWGTWYGPIGPNPAATMFMAMQHLRHGPQDWDILELRWVNARRSDRSRTSRAMRAAGFKPHQAVYDTTAVVDLPTRADLYWTTRPAKFRQNISRLSRRLESQGSVVHIRHRPDAAAEGDGDPRWDLYDLCCDIARESWQAHVRPNTTLTSPNVAGFLRATHAAAARLGMLDLNLLLVGDEPAAFAYNYHHAGTVQGLRSGCDYQVTRDGSGSVLLAKVIVDSIDRGDSLYDLGVGGQSYKMRLATGQQTSYRFTHYRADRPRAIGVGLGRWLRARRGRSVAGVPTPAKIG